MPIFDFFCFKCGGEFEDLVPPSPSVCPLCKQPSNGDIIRELFTKAPMFAGTARERIMNRANNPPTEPTHVYINRKDE